VVDFIVFNFVSSKLYHPSNFLLADNELSAIKEKTEVFGMKVPWKYFFNHHGTGQL